MTPALQPALTMYRFVRPSPLGRASSFYYIPEIANGVETMPAWTSMSEKQSEVRKACHAAAVSHADAIVGALMFAGGMRYQRIKGKEYLVRYFQVGGKKQFQSLGPRSPENDAYLEIFNSNRDRWRQDLARANAEIAEAAALVKAYRIARTPVPVRMAIERLHGQSLFYAPDSSDRLFLAGTTAMYSFECASGILFDNALLRQTPTFIELAAAGDLQEWLQAVTVALPPTEQVSISGDEAVYQASDCFVRLTVLPDDFNLEDRVADYEHPAPVSEAAWVIGRDGHIAIAPAVSPEVYVAIERRKPATSARIARIEAVEDAFSLKISEDCDVDFERSVAMRM